MMGQQYIKLYCAVMMCIIYKYTYQNPDWIETMLCIVCTPIFTLFTFISHIDFFIIVLLFFIPFHSMKRKCCKKPRTHCTTQNNTYKSVPIRTGIWLKCSKTTCWHPNNNIRSNDNNNITTSNIGNLCRMPI